MAGVASQVRWCPTQRRARRRPRRSTRQRWAPEILPLLTDGDPLGAESFATHHVPLAEAPQAYETFQRKQDGAVKIPMHP